LLEKRDEMKKLAALALSLFLAYGMALADTPKDKDADAQPAAPAKPAKAPKKAEKGEAALASQIEELRQALEAQQEELQLLKEELAKRDRQIDEAREAAASANARASEASTKAAEAVNTSAEAKSTTATLNTTVAEVKASNDAIRTTVANNEGQEKKNAEEGPTTIKFRGISITPGGFIAAETVFRNRAASADINTPLTGIPYPGSGLANVTEFNATARQSRLSLLAEGRLASVKLTGYYEADWLGTGVTSNNRQSDSYVMRQRIIFGQAAFENGFSVTAGQQWSLATENRKGIDNRNEVIPQTIDSQYTVGFTWERQFGFRLVKSFDNKVALAFAVENPQLTFGGRGFPANFFVNAVGQGGGLFNFIDTSGYSVNQTPDFIVKAAFDPGFGHYEVFGIFNTFRNRIYPCALASVANPCANGATAPSAFGAFNNSTSGGGVGVNMRWPLFAKKVDFGIHFLGGDGVGRYSSAQLADVTARPNSTLEPIRGGGALGSIEAHPSPKLDVYAYYGDEYAFRTAYTNAAGTAGIGYGSPLFNNVPCSIAALPGAAATGSVPGGTLAPAPTPPGCAGDIRNIWEGTFGFWHKPYQGTKGRFQWGIQYSYLEKAAWSGTTGTPAGSNIPGSRAKAVDNMVWTSFRYYLP
jgi:hypothetical protein